MTLAYNIIKDEHFDPNLDTELEPYEYHIGPVLVPITRFVLFWSVAICGLNCMILKFPINGMMCCICMMDMHMGQQVMTSLAKCVALQERVGGWEWADMMMVVAYNERVDFIRELEAVSGVATAVKTTEFLNDAMWKDDRMMQRLRKLHMDVDLMPYEKEKFTEKL
ncbi:hypothetical protein Tco_0371461 [Tanacetum coccineum]